MNEINSSSLKQLDLFPKKAHQSIHVKIITKPELFCFLYDCDTTFNFQAPPYQLQVMRAEWINTSLMLWDWGPNFSRFQ